MTDLRLFHTDIVCIEKKLICESLTAYNIFSIQLYK